MNGDYFSVDKASDAKYVELDNIPEVDRTIKLNQDGNNEVAAL